MERENLSPNTLPRESPHPWIVEVTVLLHGGNQFAERSLECLERVFFFQVLLYCLDPLLHAFKLGHGNGYLFLDKISVSVLGRNRERYTVTGYHGVVKSGPGL